MSISTRASADAVGRERSRVVARHRRPLRARLGQTVLHVVLIVMCAISVIPFIWTVFASFKPYKELMNSTDFLPHTWTLDSYTQVLSRSNFVSGFANTIIVAVTVTATALFTSAAVGWVFAKYQFWGKEQLFTALLATIMVPFAVVLVPLYITVSNLGLNNSLGGVMVVALWSTFGAFMMRQFMEGIPHELVDASRIDGASEWRIFLQIAIPLSKAPLGALAVFTFLWNWDNYLWPLVVLTSPDRQTLPLVLAGLRSLYWTRYDLWSAGSMLTIIPVMIVYSFASRYFIQGIALSGLKS
jgi:multiple sugar transport system permease protein